MFTKDQVKINNLISGSTNVYGIIGKPVKYSLSPLIHNTLSSTLGIDTAYMPFPVEDGDLTKAIKGAYALGIQGLNVTHPYKEDVIKHLSYVDPLAIRIGAVNTLKYEDKGYSGYNTDADGLYMSLIQNNIELKGKKVIILGAGGAARAVAIMAANYGAKSIYILNRTITKADLLAKDVKKYYNISIKALPIDSWPLLPQDCICFQTTSLGMKQSIDQVVIEDKDFYKKLSVAVDLIYNPFETLFLKKAKGQGSYIINGFGMLLYQAIRSYEIWNDIKLTNSQLDLLYYVIQELISK